MALLPRRPAAALAIALLLGVAPRARGDGPAAAGAVRTSLQADLYGRVAPQGLFLAAGLQRRWMAADADSPLLRGRYAQLGIWAGSSPSLAQGTAAAEWVPIAPLQLRVQYDAIAYYGAFGSLLTFPTAASSFGPAALRERAGTERTGVAHRLQAAPTLRARVGRVILRNQAELSWYALPTSGAWSYEAEYDTLLASRDLVLFDRLAAFFEAWRGAGEATLLAGPAYEITHAGKADLTRQRIEALLFWSPADRWGALARPRLSALVGLNLRDRNRQGEPFAGLGVGADLDL